jgi:holo-[acyl-carrier protein] synthase
LEIGIDCVEISQFGKKIISKKKILDKIYTKNEIEYCEKKIKKSQHYAVRYAGKEAVVKAFSCYKIEISMNQIEILNKKNGIPFVKILDDKLSNFNIKISLSHSGEVAIAVAIVYSNSDTKEWDILR